MTLIFMIMMRLNRQIILQNYYNRKQETNFIIVLRLCSVFSYFSKYIYKQVNVQYCPSSVCFKYVRNGTEQLVESNSLFPFFKLFQFQGQLKVFSVSFQFQFNSVQLPISSFEFKISF